MNNLRLFFVLGLMVSIMASCAVKKDYEHATSINSIAAYERHLRAYPKSKYKEDVNKKLYSLYDEKVWREALSANTISAYKNYLSRYPDGRYVLNAKSNIGKIELQNKIDSAWRTATFTNTIEGYQSFIKSYPNSQYVSEARSKIKNLEEEKSWKKAGEYDSIESYSEYLREYPYGKYSSTARSKIEKLKEEKYVLPEWNETLKINSYKAYSDFVRKHPSTSYAKMAKEKMAIIEGRDWERAQRANTVRSYKAHIDKYPFGDYAEMANKKIIDLEVDKIFQGDHGKLPPMNRNLYGHSSDNSTNSIEIYNNTQFTLTVRYSGIESTKIVLRPKQRTTVTLKKGNYRITASVDASNVRNYAGTENLTGGSYNSEYYIQTQTHRTWGY
jgi:outer membrane protein assembly factor BamD (BamD/ComL family)